MQERDVLQIKEKQYGNTLISKKEYIFGEVVYSYNILKSDIPTLYTIPINKDAYFDTSKYLLRYLCHSCEPNCHLVIKDSTLFLKAGENIRKGEELTVDYATFCLHFGPEWQLEHRTCLCGKSTCRKKVFGFEELRNSEKKKIYEHCFPYIKESN